LGHPTVSERVTTPRSTEASSILTSASLPETGYYVSRSADGQHLVIDGGPHGYRNGGHAHADALSLTLSLGGRPVLIDPGTGSYTGKATPGARLPPPAPPHTPRLGHPRPSVPPGPVSRPARARAD